MTQVAQNYADALYDLARDEGFDKQILDELTGVERLFGENPDYVRLLSASNLRKSEKLGVLDEAFSGRVHTYLLSFLKLLCERGHIRELPNCLRRCRSRYNEDHGILDLLAISAVPLSEEMRTKLIRRVADLTGKHVELRSKVDPGVLGGLRLEYEGKSLDGTVRQRLDGLKKALSDTVL